jgi:pimeloyl-ACP methyl ester carboxylesterase
LRELESDPELFTVRNRRTCLFSDAMRSGCDRDAAGTVAKADANHTPRWRLPAVHDESRGGCSTPSGGVRAGRSAMCPRYSGSSTLRPLNRPALVVWGAGDPYIPVRIAWRQQEVFTGARVIVLEQSGHWPMIDDPDAVARAVLPFLREQLGGAPRPPASASAPGQSATDVMREI